MPLPPCPLACRCCKRGPAAELHHHHPSQRCLCGGHGVRTLRPLPPGAGLGWNGASLGWVSASLGSLPLSPLTIPSFQAPPPSPRHVPSPLHHSLHVVSSRLHGVGDLEGTLVYCFSSNGMAVPMLPGPRRLCRFLASHALVLQTTRSSGTSTSSCAMTCTSAWRTSCCTCTCPAQQQPVLALRVRNAPSARGRGTLVVDAPASMA